MKKNLELCENILHELQRISVWACPATRLDNARTIDPSFPDKCRARMANGKEQIPQHILRPIQWNFVTGDCPTRIRWSRKMPCKAGFPSRIPVFAQQEATLASQHLPFQFGRGVKVDIVNHASGLGYRIVCLT